MTAFSSLHGELSSLFDDGQWRQLTVILKQIQPMFPRFWSTSAGSDFEPDGYQGIGQSGNIDQLLPTELALAGLMPMEFLRRYNMSELSYLKRHFNPVHSGGGCLLLLNTGPRYWGNPKLIQLAFLVALYARSTKLGVDFTWSLLSEWNPNTGLTTDPIKHFLSNTESIDSDGSAWQEFHQQYDEVWVFGSNLKGEGIWQVLLDEDWQHENLMHLSLHHAERRKRTRPLILPPPADRLSILRRPQEFTRQRHDNPEPDLSRQAELPFAPDFLQISPRGTRLLIACSEKLAWIPIPNSQNDPIGRWRHRIRQNGSCLSLGYWQKCVQDITWRDNKLHIYHPFFINQPTEAIDPHSIVRLKNAYPLSEKPRFIYLQSKDQMAAIAIEQEPPNIKTFPGEIVAHALGQQSFWISRIKGTNWLFLDGKQDRRLIHIRDAEQVYFDIINERLALAWCIADKWFLGWERQSPLRINVPPEARVLGFVNGSSNLEILWVEADRMTLSLFHERQIVSFSKLPSPIRQVDVNPRRCLVTVLTECDSVWVFDASFKKNRDHAVIRFIGRFQP